MGVKMRKKLFFLILCGGLFFLTACNLQDAVTPEVDDTAVKAFIAATQTEGDSPLEVAFDGSNSSSANGTITTFAWNFGDGQYGTGVKVTHTYLKAGKYTASLTVTDSKTGNNAATAIISVDLGSKIYVNASYTGSTSTGSQQAPFKTIAEALAVASDTQTVQILAGTYNESIELKIGITLAGESRDKVFIQPVGTNGISIDKLSSQTVISGITFKNASNCAISCGLATNLKISDCAFQNNSIGIKTFNNSNPVIENCIFNNNQTALYFENNSSPEVKTCTIDGNVRGIFIDNNATPRFSNNTINQNSGAGVVIENYSSPTLDANTISSNGGYGIKISVFSAPIFSNNQISLNAEFDVKCTDDYSNFTDSGGNTIEKCGSCLACGEESILQVAGRYEGTGKKTDGSTAVRAVEIDQNGTNLTLRLFNQQDGILPSSPNDTATASLKAGESKISFISTTRKDEWSLDFSTSGKITGTQKVIATGIILELDLSKKVTKSLKFKKGLH
jgi:parallel beta-helix repeat protein